jgi:catechol 2,3-dioxygenase-like lactoylglutathione lyase family enzyme
MIRIDRLDHLVLTVADIDVTCEFYARVFGMGVVTFGQGRKALSFGRQKINLHRAGHEFEPKAHRPTPGSADLCLIAETPLEDVVAHLRAAGISIKEGPVDRTSTYI